MHDALPILVHRWIIQAYVYTILCFSEMSLPTADLFPDLIVLTLPHERSADPIPRIFEVTLQATNSRTFVDGNEYFWCHRWLLPSVISLLFQIKSLLSKGSLLWLNKVYSLQNVSRDSCKYFSVHPANKLLITLFTWIWCLFCAFLNTSSLMWDFTHNIQPVTIDGLWVTYDLEQNTNWSYYFVY